MSGMLKEITATLVAGDLTTGAHKLDVVWRVDHQLGRVSLDQQVTEDHLGLAISERQT